MDYQIVKWFNGLANQNFYLDIFGIILAEFLIFSLPLIIILFYFFSDRKKGLFFLILKIIFSLIFAYSLNYLIGLIFLRPRPFVNHQEIYQLAKFFAKTTDYSFPSYHTTTAFVMSFMVLFDWRKFGTILLILSLLVGLGRIFVGVHYPMDILGGIVTSLLAVISINFIFKYFNIRKVK
ncbi:MAG: phosphatase PAP2 family protein [Patescibacteria group bacterium]|jgi:undecaprenyl-diphosphatase|nr:phosphatase PAP2 family protein [Patescibacteria group bacterium]MDD5172993.1 phosphatase PAP2 family protein [Patescibacteria group bacterium]